jgi:hypothetical protein
MHWCHNGSPTEGIFSFDRVHEGDSHVFRYPNVIKRCDANLRRSHVRRVAEGSATPKTDMRLVATRFCRLIGGISQSIRCKQQVGVSQASSICVGSP